MARSVRALTVLILISALCLSGCGIRNAKLPALQTVRLTASTVTETTEPGSAWASWTSKTETDAAEACDVALPMERALTTETEETTEAETEPPTTVPSTTTPTTTTTAPSTTVTETTTATTKPTTTKPTTTKPTTTKPTTAKAAKTAAAKTTTRTSTDAATSAQKAQSAPTSAQAILNRAVLHPQKTNDAELDAAVQQVFSQIFRPGMSTYDKVLACYNYIINNAEYGRTKMTVTQDDLQSYQTEQDVWIVLFAKRILNTGTGVCDDYSALFLVMTRAIGLDCYYTHGYTTNTKGETKDHVWDTITVDGVDYIFDPQVEDKQSANGIKYTFFCQPYTSSIAKIYSGYDLAADKAAYNAFRK